MINYLEDKKLGVVMLPLKYAINAVSFIRIKPQIAIWEQFFGPYPWFCAPLIGDFAGWRGLIVSEVHSRYRRELTEIIPATLKENSRWGQWGELSLVQFKATLSQSLVRLDKAIQSILITRLASQSNDYIIDDNNLTQLIIPLTFVVDGLDRVIKDKEVVAVLGLEIGQSSFFLEEAARGFGLPEYLALRIVEICNKLGFVDVYMRLLRDRTDVIHGQRRRIRPVIVEEYDHELIAKYYRNAVDWIGA
jgi:hypothetical protein